MYLIVAGGGKVGANLSRSLIGHGHEVTMIEQRADRFEMLEEEFEHQVQIDRGSPCVGKTVDRIVLPAGSQLISVVRNGQAKIADGETTLEAGDQVLAILEPGKTDELKRVLLNKR